MQPARQRPGHDGQHDVVDRAPEGVLHRLVVGQLVADDRVAAMGADLDVERRLGCRVQPGPDDLADALGGVAERAERGDRAGGRGHRARHEPGGEADAPRARRRRRARAGEGSGLGCHGSSSLGGRAGGSGSRSNSTVARSTPATPSTSAWWVLEISAKRSPSSPSTSQFSHSGFARSSCCEAIRAASRNSCSSLPGRRQRGMADVVLEVEVGIVDPQRPARLERRRGQLLPVARHQVQPAADVVEEVGEVRRRALRRSAPPPMCMCEAGPS